MAKGKAIKAKRHFNDALTQDKADLIVKGVLQNDSLAEITKASGLSEVTTFKYVRGVKVDIDYPETREEWQSAVTDYLGIAIWKATKALAEGGIDGISDDRKPLAMAILLDKKLLMEGTPTNITASMNISVSHKDLLNELKPKSSDIDV